MALSFDTHSIDYQPISSLLLTTILSAFTILTAFCIRDAVIQGIQLVGPDNLSKRFAFSVMIAAFFLLMTVLIAWIWQDQIDG